VRGNTQSDASRRFAATLALVQHGPQCAQVTLELATFGDGAHLVRSL